MDVRNAKGSYGKQEEEPSQLNEPFFYQTLFDPDLAFAGELVCFCT